jgi:transposase
LFHAFVHSADIQDRDGGVLVMATLLACIHAEALRRRQLPGADLSVHRPQIFRQIDVEIVKRSDTAKGFAVLPKRWIVERTIAWLNRCRRLAKDWECVNRKALAFLRLASSRLMLRKLCQKHHDPGQTLRERLATVGGPSRFSRAACLARRESSPPAPETCTGRA